MPIPSTGTVGPKVAARAIKPRAEPIPAPRGLARIPVASVCAASSVLLVITGLTMYLLAGVRELFSSYWLVDASQGIAYAAVGFLIASRRPRHVVAWLFLAIGLSHALALAMGAYATLTLELGESAPILQLRVAIWLESWVWAPGLFTVATVLPLLFPDGSLPSRRFRFVAWSAVVSISVFVAGLALGAAPSEYPVKKLIYVPIAEPLTSLGMLAITATALGAVIGLTVRYRRSVGLERLQLRWFVFATLVAIAAAMPWIPQGTSVLVQFFALPLIPIACGLAILKHRLYELNVVVNRALVYLVSSALLLSAYLGVVTFLGRTFGRGLASDLVAVGVVAVFFAPVRGHVQRVIDRLLYGQRREPYALVSRLGHELTDLADPSAALERAVHTVADALKLPYVAIHLEVGGQPAPFKETGTPSESVRELPLVYGGRHIGILVAGLRSGQDEFADADRRVLEDVAQHLSVAAYSARVTFQLQRSRRDLVAAQAEERRRIRRELHDELGPRLAGVNLQAEAASQLISTDPDAACRMLNKAGTEARQAVEDIRTIAYGLRPPALDELGLIAALEEHAARLIESARGELDIRLDAPTGLPPLPAAVEVATYRIAVEALANVARHSGATRCDMSLAFGDDVEIQVTDDGHGFATDSHVGVGIASMHERAEELGGQVAIGSPAGGGTIVHATLPIEWGS